MKWPFLILLAAAFTGTFVLLQYDTITGGSSTDSATLTITFTNLEQPTDSPQQQSGMGGNGGSGSNSQNSVAPPATYGRATSAAKRAPSDDTTKNYYESQPLQFAPIGVTSHTLQSQTDEMNTYYTKATAVSLIAVLIIILVIMFAIISAHKKEGKKHKLKRNKV